jgi:hypothetical protein
MAMDVVVQMRLLFVAGLVVLAMAILLIALLVNLAQRHLAERLREPRRAVEPRHESASSRHLGHRIELRQARWRLLL